MPVPWDSANGNCLVLSVPSNFTLMHLDLQQYHPLHRVFEGVHGIDICNGRILKFQNWILSLGVVSISPSQIVKISSNHGCVSNLLPKSHGKWLDLTQKNPLGILFFG